MATSHVSAKEMAKLQKSSRQRERHSVILQQKQANLTPAEIRAANNNVSPADSRPKSRRDSWYIRHARTVDRTTPPSSPDHSRTSHHDQVKRASTMPLPTPPQSPVVYYSRVVNPLQTPPNFSRPRNRTSMAIEQQGSRRSSLSSVSSYRGVTVPTYRGPEMTRNGSLTLIQRPAQDIVANPLSNFSRPRVSGSNPPAAQRLSTHDDHVCDHRPLRNQRSQSFDSAVSAMSRQPKGNLAPPPRNMSPVSFEEKRSFRDFKTGYVASSRDQHMSISPSISSDAAENVQVATARQMSVTRSTPTSAEKKLRRHTLQTSADGTISHSIPGMNPDSSTTDASRSNIRPTSMIGPSSILKGKERESIDTAPLTRCCNKCGKFKKRFDATKFAMAPLVEDHGARLTSSPTNEVRKICVADPNAPEEPPTQILDRRSKRTSGVKWPDQRAEGKIRPPPAPPGITRFASLRGFTSERPEVTSNVEEAEERNDSGVLITHFAPADSRVQDMHDMADSGPQSGSQSGPPLDHNLDDSNWTALYPQTTGTDIHGTSPEAVTTNLIPYFANVSNTMQSSGQPQYYAAATEVESQTLSADANGYHYTPSSESDGEGENKPKLPKPVLGRKFARSNQTLRGFVLPKGRSQTNLLEFDAAVQARLEQLHAAQMGALEGSDHMSMNAPSETLVNSEMGGSMKEVETSQNRALLEREKQVAVVAELMAV